MSSLEQDLIKFCSLKEKKASDLEGICTQVKQNLDYLRCSFVDLNGVHMTKLIAADRVDKLAQNQVELNPGVIGFGPRFEFVKVPEVFAKKNENGILVPKWETLHSLPWVGETDDEVVGVKRVGAVLCDMHWPTGPVLDAMPRVVAQRMIDRLFEKHGLRLKSGFEPEFRLFRADTVNDEFLAKPGPSVKLMTRRSTVTGHPLPIGKGDESIDQEKLAKKQKCLPIPCTFGEDMLKTDVLNKYEQFILRLDHYLQSIGIRVQDYMIENGESQLETPLEPLEGMASPDAYQIFKQAVKEIAAKCQMQASFMTKPLLDTHATGCHFNHSLWDGQNKNAFWDPNDANKLSKLATHWIGGIMSHHKALVALCCPTVNCYRRLGIGWAPSRINWDFHDRFMSLRVKNNSEAGTFMENRLPSSAACAYHVLAATLAAGMDGIERKLIPPKAGLECDISAQKLPVALEQALDFLNEDHELKQVLGVDFVEWFVRAKQEDLKKMPYMHHAIHPECDLDALISELHEYFQYI